MIFLAFPNPVDSEGLGLEFGQRRGLIQLIHVAGSEHDPGFSVNHPSPGFCHTCVSVPDLEQAMQRMKGLGVQIVEEGSNDLGFGAIADPDGYSIQLLHCEIDQSLALKKQLAEMMSLSSSSSNRRLSAISSHRKPSLSDITRSNSAEDSFLAPSLQGFKGGSPNFEHPHWLSLQRDSSNTAARGDVSPRHHSAGVTTVGTSMTTRQQAEFSPAATLAAGVLNESRGRTQTNSVVKCETDVKQDVGGSSSSSSASHQGSSRSSLLTGLSSRRQSRGSSPGSISRPNAPTAIDLSQLTPMNTEPRTQPLPAPIEEHVSTSPPAPAPVASSASILPASLVGDNVNLATLTCKASPSSTSTSTMAKPQSAHSQHAKRTSTASSFRSLRDRLSGRTASHNTGTQPR